MRLEFAFLADAATMQDDGTFAVVAGGFEVFVAEEFPAQKPIIVLIARLVFEPKECNTKHTYTCEFLDPNGGVVFPAFAGEFSPPSHPRHPERGNTMTLCLNAAGAIFSAPGDYAVRLSIDGKPVVDVPIEAVSKGGRNDHVELP
jgi:hypothetical protein